VSTDKLLLIMCVIWGFSIFNKRSEKAQKKISILNFIFSCFMLIIEIVELLLLLKIYLYLK